MYPGIGQIRLGLSTLYTVPALELTVWWGLEGDRGGVWEEMS